MIASVEMRLGDGTWVIRVVTPGERCPGDLPEYPSCFLCPLTLPIFHLGFSIEGPSQAKIECDDKGDGSCDVRYWPTEPGEYAVHVICDDEDIRDSPFIAHIQPAPPDCFPDKVGVPAPAGLGQGEQALLQSPTQPSGLAPAQVKAFGPGLEPTGCIVDKPAEFTIDARAAGKGDLKLYAQVGCCPISVPLAAVAGTLGDGGAS